MYLKKRKEEGNVKRLREKERQLHFNLDLKLIQTRYISTGKPLYMYPKTKKGVRE